jgi:hypothetical protein
MSNLLRGPASFCETCQWLKFPPNGLRAQSRVSPAVGLLPLASEPACLGMAFPPFLVKQLYRFVSVVIPSFVRTGYTTRRRGWQLGSIARHYPLYPPPFSYSSIFIRVTWGCYDKAIRNLRIKVRLQNTKTFELWTSYTKNTGMQEVRKYVIERAWPTTHAGTNTLVYTNCQPVVSMSHDS